MSTANIKLKQTKRFVRTMLLAPVMLLVTITSQFSHADIVQVNASSQPSNVSATANSQSNVSWRVSQRSSIGGQAIISSPGGSFYSTDGTLLGQINTAIQSSRLAQLRVTTLFVLNESLTVPLSIIRAAQKSASSNVIYQRSFIDSQDGTTTTASVNFKITHKAVASEFVINRIQMQFEDGKATGVYGNQAEFSASAFVSYQGTGLLEYSWEVASPPSTNATPIFFPLVSRKQYLLSGGQITLQSPSLPSTNNGNYLVRLKVGGIDNRDRLPTIRYIINQSALDNSNSDIAKLSQKSPLIDALLVPSTEFKWSAVGSASAYQLEIHSKPTHSINSLALEQEPPITGVLIPANKTRIKVGSVSRTYLIPGNNYYWRVIAINETGQIIARSEFRRIKF
mgnify:FL=1